jgi:hypothetical protein
MEKDTEVTNVQFYIATYPGFEGDEQPTKEVLAVFVDEKYYSEDNIGYGRVTKKDVENTFVGYVHNGQHTAVCKEFIVQNCRKASQEEYQELFNELENLVGYNLNVI